MELREKVTQDHRTLCLFGLLEFHRRDLRVGLGYLRRNLVNFSMEKRSAFGRLQVEQVLHEHV
ncbi:MAG TPA: hypothetical protein VH349_15840 [Ktedonobacterales bacterium]